MAGRPPPARPGARAAPAAPSHNLYVLVLGANDRTVNDLKSRKLTMEILNYIKTRLPTLRQMGISVGVQRVEKSYLKNPRVREAMKKKGIKNLPALVTPTLVYLGVAEIRDLYEKNILEFQAWNRREEGPIQGAAPEDALSAFYASEMNLDRFKEDATGGSDGGLGEEDSSGMMDAFHQMVRRRESRDAQRTAGTRVAPLAGADPQDGYGGGGGGGGGYGGGYGGGHPAAQTARPAAARHDNVDDALTGIDALIGQMAGEINQQTVAAAFSGHGGDSVEDGSGTGDAQDSLMMQRYWENQESSM